MNNSSQDHLPMLSNAGILAPGFARNSGLFFIQNVAKDLERPHLYEMNSSLTVLPASKIQILYYHSWEITGSSNC